jgi:phosphatidylserine/phosphatidylglycerophosphate/cardiolipin synthase-like enzyme
MRYFIPFLLVGAFIYIAHQSNFSDQLSSLISTKVSTVAAGDGGASHYSPGENLEAIDSSDIVNSRCDHLDIAMYSFTDQELAQSVIRFANSGHQVRIYRDREQYEQESNRNIRVISMFRGNRNISIQVKASTVLMHVKSWSDGCVLRDGSANWSPSGERQQDNTLTLTSDPAAVVAFEAKFNQMWNRPDNQHIQ